MARSSNAHLIREAKAAVRDVKTATERAARNAGDIAGRQWVTSAVKYVRRKKNLKASLVRSGIRLLRPGRGADHLEWTVKIVGKAVPLVSYPWSFSKRGQGVRVRVNKGRGQLLPGGFIDRSKSGRLGVFIPSARGKRMLFSSRLTDVLRDDGVIDALVRNARERFRTEYAQGIVKQLAKLR